MFEVSILIIFFGIERVSEKIMKRVRLSVKVISLLPFALIIYLLLTNDISFGIVNIFTNHVLLQAIPFIGWNIAFIHLIFTGPTIFNVIFSILYLLSGSILFIIARKMQCTGEYYEDAMKFADEYEEAIQRGKKGEVAIVGQTKKYKNATIQYKGYGAKAIFCRQLLEYKKRRFFIFGMTSLLNFGIGIILSYVFLRNRDKFEPFAVFIIPGVCAYSTFILSGYATKWSKELEHAYTYLIPASSLQKLWYATLVEHIRSFVDGLLLAVPAGIVMKLNVWQIVLSVFIYVCLQGNKLYTVVLGEAFLGDTLGKTGKQIFKMLVQGFVMGLCIMVAIIGSVMISIEVGYLLLILVSIILTSFIFMLASTVFNRMEQLDYLSFRKL